MPGFAPERLSGGFFPVERYSQTYRQASPGKQVNPAHSLSPSCCGKTAGNCVLRLGSAEKAPPDLKDCRCRGQSAQGRFPQGRGHGLADFSHRRNNLVKGDNAFYTGKGHVGGGTHYRTCVPLDAGNFHKPRHRIADKAKLVFQGDGSGVKYGGGARAAKFGQSRRGGDDFPHRGVVFRLFTTLRSFGTMPARIRALRSKDHGWQNVPE